jgi:hypothetical protein
VSGLRQVAADLEALWPSAYPELVRLRLEELRRLVAERDARDPLLAFLQDAEDVPGEVVVVLTQGGAMFLVDDGGERLEFA